MDEMSLRVSPAPTIECTTWYCADCGKSLMVIPRGAMTFDSELGVGVGCCSGTLIGVCRKRPIGWRSKHYKLAKHTLDRMRSGERKGE